VITGRNITQQVAALRLPRYYVFVGGNRGMKSLRPLLVVAVASLVITVVFFASAPASVNLGRAAHASPQPPPHYWDPSKYKMVAVSSAAPPQAVICDPTTTNQCATVNSSNNLSVAVNNNPKIHIDDSTGTNSAGVDAQNNLQTKMCDPNTMNQCAAVTGNNGAEVDQANGQWYPAPGSSAPTQVTGSTCFSISSTIRRVKLLDVVNPQSQPSSASIQVYDEAGPSPSCSSTDEIDDTGNVGAGAKLPYNFTVAHGIAMKCVNCSWTATGDGIRIFGSDS
jgi:hypothetical protein